MLTEKSQVPLEVVAIGTFEVDQEFLFTVNLTKFSGLS